MMEKGEIWDLLASLAVLAFNAYGFECVCVCCRATKSPLKVQNRVPEADSPIKKVAKRGRHVLDSDDDDVPAVKEEVTKQADKEVKREKVNASMGLGGCCCQGVCETQPNTRGGGGGVFQAPLRARKRSFFMSFHLSGDFRTGMSSCSSIEESDLEMSVLQPVCRSDTPELTGAVNLLGWVRGPRMGHRHFKKQYFSTWVSPWHSWCVLF